MQDTLDSCYRQIDKQQDEIEELTEEIGRLREDAARYRFIRTHKMQAYAIKMGGTASWRFRSGWPELKGRSQDEAIDAAIKVIDEPPD